MSTTKSARRPRKGAVGDDYLALIRHFPLRPLRSDSDLRQAGEVLDQWLGKPNLTTGQRDYLATLVRLVRDYEQEKVRRGFRNLTPIDLLKHLMRENQMNTSELGYILGSRGLASEVLNGKRGLSKTLITKLSRRFGVEPALFLDAKENAA
jgi:HTH-type transcriptional regulator/antitoxin HigA